MTFVDKKPLVALLDDLAHRRVGDTRVELSSLEVCKLSFDSREVTSETLFFAIKGEAADGRTFIPQAIEKGAVAVIADALDFDESLISAGTSVPLFLVEDARETLSAITRRFFAEPDDHLFAIGVTGTNGKTSTAWILAEALSVLLGPSAYIGTLGIKLASQSPQGEVEFPNISTTSPDPISVFQSLSRLQAIGAKAVVCEVSSHGLAQKRMRGVGWDRVLFTNLTRDHLDYHGSFEEYYQAKKLLFDTELRSSGKADTCGLCNIDDEFGARLYQESAGLKVASYSAAGKEADYSVGSCRLDFSGTEIEVLFNGESATIHSQLVGRYNVENMLAAAATLLSAGHPVDAVVSALAKVTPIPGRLQSVGSETLPVFVDYAHTPDALLNVQRSLKELNTDGRLITVFGCGGDRDRGKRPLMAEAVASLSDFAIVTSDNPRTEDPEQIIADIIPGLDTDDPIPFEAICDRRDAISHAIEMAGPGDVVLVAGKGHEDYQEVHGVKHPFDDATVCREIISELGK